MTPHLLGWDVQTLDAVQAFICAFNTRTKQEEKHGEPFVTIHWLKEGRLEWKVMDILQDNALAPIDPVKCFNAQALPPMEDCGLESAHAGIAFTLFGLNGYQEPVCVQFVLPKVRYFIHSLLNVLWHMWRRAIHADHRQMVMQKAELDKMWAESIEGIPKVLHDGLAKLATEQQARCLQAEIAKILKDLDDDFGMSSDEDADNTVEYEENNIRLAQAVEDWKEGIEQYKRYLMDNLWNMLGLCDVKQIPDFQEKINTDGTCQPWTENGA
ncbi:hypothetical protein EDD16DRAFT_1522575 [Pisolithus croceorrhizus]|nr:hypothetical protein EV401DRAFT_1894367 [Pisolithus croceorrhizus]KAI6109254.1 hypothetical protein EDD16DRAFT_1522575 [Pisolithus croceorrhizus]KAI6145742.1 hypothetical protein EDD17DRAFT_1514865 [Pisolithus thermaeus]